MSVLLLRCSHCFRWICSYWFLRNERQINKHTWAIEWERTKRGFRVCGIVAANHFIIIVVLARCYWIENPTRRDHKLNELMIIGCTNDTNAGALFFSPFSCRCLLHTIFFLLRFLKDSFDFLKTDSMTNKLAVTVRATIHSNAFHCCIAKGIAYLLNMVCFG